MSNLLTNLLIANSVALLNMFIPMASPDRATNLMILIRLLDSQSPKTKSSKTGLSYSKTPLPT